MTPKPWEDPELWERLRPLFYAAMELPEVERARYVEEACGDDRELYAALQQLVSATGDSSGPVDRPLFDFRSLFPDARHAFSEGELVFGRFRIARLIGSGGMGEVYDAIDLELGQHIALKTIRADITDDPQMLRHFKNEVKLAQRVSSLHICRIHELYVLADSDDGRRRAFLTMEFLNGVTLADRIREAGALPWKEVKTIALEICEGLRVMHEAGIIHRDIKSRNVMLADRNGAVKAIVMDFGLAHEMRTATSETATSVSEEHSVVGTVEYMAPEQFEGQTLTPASDIFALGVVMYESATGKHPFPSRTILEAAVQRGRRPLTPSSIQKKLPHRCDEIVGHCLEFDPKKRYQSAKIVSEEIKDSLPAKLRRTWLRAVAALFALIVLTSGLMLVPSIRERVQGILFSSREKHIAVLPFEVVGNDPQTQALGDGLMDSLAGKLSNLDAANQRLWVVPASEVRSRKVKDASSALKEFGATIVLLGNFERSGPGAHLRLTLIDPKKMREIGFADVENAMGDLAALEDEAVIRLGRLMNVPANANVVRDSTGQVGGAAYEDYLEGLGYMQRYDKMGNLDAAIKSFQKAVATDPQFALGIAQLGEAYRLKYQLDRNPEWLESAQVSCKHAISLDSRISAAYVTLAIIQEATGNHELAVHEFQRALDNDPRDTKALSGLAHAYEQVGRLAEAESILKKAAALRPTYWDGYNTLGTFYRNHGKIPQAIAQFKHALSLTPDNAQVCANLGAAYIDSGDPKLLPDAEEALKRSIALQPNYMALANLGALYVAQNRYAEAADATEKAVQINGNDWIVWSNLVAIYEWLKLPTKASVAEREMLKLLEKTVQLKPEDAQAQSALAVIYAHMHLNGKAMDRIQTSLALAPNDPVVLSSVGDAYELSGYRALAINFIQKALKNGLTRPQVEQDPYLQQLISDPAFQSPPS
jgi:eukaryotic-like serine/threonine-protein kinase